MGRRGNRRAKGGRDSCEKWRSRLDQWRLFFGAFGCGLAGFVNGCCRRDRRDVLVLAMERDEFISANEFIRHLHCPSPLVPTYVLLFLSFFFLITFFLSFFL